MTLIFLLRHAECEGNVIKALAGRTDFKLTEKGKETAKRLVERLKEYNIDNIYSSPSSRCLETIKPVANYFKLKINICQDLKEKDFGIYDGMTWKEVEKLEPQILRNKQKYNEITGIQGQETTENVKNRMNKCMRKIAQENNNKIIIVCSHGCAIEVFLRSIDNIMQTEEREKYSQKNGSVNVLQYENNQFKIIKLG